MGLFSKKENIFLPVAKNRFYIEYQFPSSSSKMMTNFEWLETCMRNSQTGKAIWKVENPIDIAYSIFLENERFLQEIGNRIQGVANSILERIGEKVNQENLDLFNAQLLLGGALAFVEIRSGLAINGLMHPSIQNAICFARTSSEKSSNLQLDVQADKAIEIGYGLLRYSKEPVERFLENIRRLS
jgi:hypothetical protein